jgi:hypothetical protein
MLIAESSTRKATAAPRSATLLLGGLRSAAETIQINLRGWTPEARYQVTFEDHGIAMEKISRELFGGVGIKIPQAHGSLLVTCSTRRY